MLGFNQASDTIKFAFKNCGEREEWKRSNRQGEEKVYWEMVEAVFSEG